MNKSAIQVTGCILARNESAKITEALTSLKTFCSQIIVLDNESTDNTANIARELGAAVIPATSPSDKNNFDGLRNLAVEHAIGEWLFFLDADERVPPPLGPILLRLIAEQGHEFDALMIPFRTYFCGKWIEHCNWWPSYTRPQLLKKGCFHYNDLLHSGVSVKGKTLHFSAENPALAITHYSYDNLHQYLEKLNRYTDGEALNLFSDGQRHDWQAQLASFLRDWQIYYDRGEAYKDGMHGFVLSFLSAFYRFASRAKLWDVRRQQGLVPTDKTADEALPKSVLEMVDFLRKIALQSYTAPSNRQPSSPALTTLPLIWFAPFLDGSGYADEARHFALGLMESNIPVALSPAGWGDDFTAAIETDRARIIERFVPRDHPCDVFVSMSTPPGNMRSPHARVNIVRTMFETDRIRSEWVPILNAFDRIWVPSKFGRDTFAASGVALEKIAVVPEAMDTELYERSVEEGVDPWPNVPGNEPFRFLSVFDWKLHKGWDVLLTAFAQEFGQGSDTTSVGLTIKAWGYPLTEIHAQADAHLKETTGKGLESYPNIHIWEERIPAGEMPRLYQAVQAYVTPTRGEGWGRPLMEAMAVGLPTIATAWSGVTEFHNGRVGYTIKYQLVDVPPEGAKETVIYDGHQWAEPDIKDLRRKMRLVVANPAEAAKKGKAARRHILATCSRKAVTEIVQREIAIAQAAVPTQAVPVQTSLQTSTHLAEKQQTPLAVYNASIFPELPYKSDTLLVQCVRDKNSSHAQLLSMVAPYHAAYAQRHNMDYLCCYSQGDGLAPRRTPHWDKIALLRYILATDKYRTIIWLDADTIIAQKDCDLRIALPEDRWIGLVLHRDPARSGQEHLNNGAMYLRNTPECRALFEEIWSTWPVNDPWEDKAALQHILHKTPERWRSGLVILNDAWNSTTRVNESRSPIVMAWHGFGSVDARLESMRVALQALMGGETKAPSPPQQSPQVHIPASRPIPRDIVAPVSLFQQEKSDDHSVLKSLRVRWEGDHGQISSLSLVNGILVAAIEQAGDALPIENNNLAEPVRDIEIIRAQPSGELLPADLTIRHFFPPDWSPTTDGTPLIVMQPWEWAYVPSEWVSNASTHVRQVWVNSRFTRDAYVRSGVPAEKVEIIPLGVREKYVFTPDGPLYPLTTQRRMRFLFVGGTIYRKGADILLEAYRRAFTRQDDVCLVVKDMGTHSFYSNQNLASAFRQAQVDPSFPEIEYIGDPELSEKELASLYRACSVLVLPYRGEGFALTPLEAMACGKCPIVTAGGSTEDYLDDSCSLRIPARRRLSGKKQIGSLPCPGDPWNLEPDLDSLIAALRWAYEHPDQIDERGRRARIRVEEGWTWERAAAVARQKLASVVSASLPNTAAQKSVSIQAGPTTTPIAVPFLSDTSLEDIAPKAKTGKSRKASTSVKSKQNIRLSLCLIARDEEARVGACLESIRPYVDEMVVVDTGSVDRTREIARDLGAHVFDLPWPDSFAAARNASLDQAHGDWIFWMDADDVITPESGELLRKLIQAHPDRQAAFQAQVRIPPGPGEFTESVVDHVKLFPNRPDLRFEHRIHEQILPSLRRANIPVKFSDLYVTHQHYDRSPEGQARKRRRDFHLLALDLKDRPNHPFVLFNLGMTHLFATHEYEVAAQYLERSLAASHPNDSIVRKAFALLTTARTCQEEWNAALQANESGRRYYPDDAELLFQAGQIYQRVGRPEDARTVLEKLIAGEEHNTDSAAEASGRAHYKSVDTGLRTSRGPHELALLYRRMGNLDQCVRLLEQVVSEHPEYVPARKDLEITLSGMSPNPNRRAATKRFDG